MNVTPKYLLIVLALAVIVLSATVAFTPIREEAHWRFFTRTDDGVALNAYLSKWPTGRHAKEAQATLDKFALEDARKALDPELAKTCRQTLDQGRYQLLGGNKGWAATDNFVGRNPNNAFGLYIKAATFNWMQFWLPKSMLSDPIADLKRALEIGLPGRQAGMARELLSVLQSQTPPIPYKGSVLEEPHADRDPIMKVSDAIAADLKSVCAER